MSRFNNPQTPQPQRGVPQPVAPQRQEPRPVPPPTNPYGSLSSYGQQGYAADGHVQPQPQAAQSPGPFSALRPDHRYAQPAADPYAANGYAAPADSFNALAGQAAAGYAAPAPAYDPYAAAAPHAGGYAAQAGYAPVQSQATAPAAYQDPYAARQDLRSASFDQWSPGSLPQSDPYQGGTHQAANGYEPQSFDAQGFPVGRAPAAAAPAHAPAHWGAQTDPYAQPGYGAQANGFDAGGFDAGGLDAAGAFGGGAYPQQQPAATSFEQGYAEDEAEYEDDVAAPRSYKRLAVLLASTVILGGGLALAYVNLTAAPQTTASAPVVKGDDSPFKVKPSDPGGKQFAHTDSKVMGRLGEGTAASGSSTGDVDPVTGARKVSTVVVGRDGSIQSGAAESSAPPAAPAPSSASIPGMVVVGVPPAASASEPAAPQSQTVAASGPPAETAAAADQAASLPSTPKKPQMIATASVPPSASASAAAPAETAAAAPAAAPPKKEKKVAALAPAAPASSGATPTPARPTGAGYVAVLASVPASASSRIDALKQFADLQQKYGTILSDKTPDVMEASVSGKGTYHRLVVGPPGSREGANQVCSQLKAQGYASCWVMAY